MAGLIPVAATQLAAIAAAVAAVVSRSVVLSSVLAVIAVVLACTGPALAARRAARGPRSSLRDLADSAAAITQGTPGRRLCVPRAPPEASRLALELNRMLQRLDDWTRLRAVLAGNLDHRIRTPLSSLLAEVQLLRPRAPDREELLDFLDRAEVELRELARVTEGLLVVERLDTAHDERVPVRDLVRRASNRCREAARRGSVLLEEDQPAAEPNELLLVPGDTALLQVLVEDLLLHAIRRTPRGGRVAVGAGGGPGAVRITVRGKGRVPLHVRARTALVDAERPDELSVARSIARWHGGGIRVEDGDASFTIGVVLPATGGERLDAAVGARAGGPVLAES